MSFDAAPLSTPTVESFQKISDVEGEFIGVLDDNDFLGRSLPSLGDLDGDGVDMVVGAFGDDDGGQNRGAVWVQFLNSNGTVKFHQKISDITGNFNGTINDYDQFGYSVTSIGDLNGDGNTDIAVGAVGADTNGNSQDTVCGFCFWIPTER